MATSLAALIYLYFFLFLYSFSFGLPASKVVTPAALLAVPKLEPGLEPISAFSSASKRRPAVSKRPPRGEVVLPAEAEDGRMEKLRYGWQCSTCKIRMRSRKAMAEHVTGEHPKKK